MLGLVLDSMSAMAHYHDALLRKCFAVTRTCLAYSSIFPLAVGLAVVQSVTRALRRQSLRIFGPEVDTNEIDEAQFPGTIDFERVISKLEVTGLRSTASNAHEKFITWVKNELAQIQGLSVTTDTNEVLRWQTAEGRTLKQAGSLVLKDASGEVEIDIAGAVPYSRPSAGSTGQLMYVAPHESITSKAIKGTIVVRKISDKSLPMILARLPAHSPTPDFKLDYFGNYNRPSFWEIPIHQDLIDAGSGGAAGVIFLIDLPRFQIESYWDPHQGTHYEVPALFCGTEDTATLMEAASRGKNAIIVIRGEVSKAQTANILGSLSGSIEETVVYVTHTDGNTCDQDNGVAALLTLARYLSSQPVSSRWRTLQFAFNTAHLHVSREGSGRHAQQLDEKYDTDRNLTLVIPVEHLGTRELTIQTGSGSRDRRLVYTGYGEVMIWCVGSSGPLVSAVEDAMRRRKLDRVLVTRGLGLPQISMVPTYKSFGGLGTLYNAALLPTTSIISGPWSLSAPSFGSSAVDVERLRQQTLALGDVYVAVERLTREQIAGSYMKQRRRRREKDSKVYEGFICPPETLPVVNHKF